MISFLGKRLLAAIPVLFGVATLTFFLIHFVPGDPVDLMLGEQASPADKAALTTELGLDQPLGIRYVSFLKGVLHADLGRSMTSRRPVSDEIRARLPATLELAAAAMLLALALGTPAGVIAAVKRRSWVDKVLRGVSLIGLSTPSFWIGPMFVLIFALKLDWFPVSERGGLEHLFLPALTLAFGLACVLMQITRASLIEVVNEDYIATARAKGAGPIRLWFKHALANALVPIIAVVGLQFGAVLTGAVIVETIFDWPGLGTLLYQAIQQRNYPLVQGCVLTIAVLYVVVNILADLAYTLANPKLRMQ